MSSESIKVMVRCRPLNKNEDQNKCIQVVCSKQMVELKNPSNLNNLKHFYFEEVFDENQSQQHIYENSAFKIVDNIFEGYNGTILAYG